MEMINYDFGMNVPQSIMATIRELLHAHETIRKFSNEREFPAQLQAIFLLIGMHGSKGMAQADIAPVLGLSASSVSRNLSWLGPKNKLKRRSGLKWIEIFQCPDNYKANRVKLTALGKVVLDEALAEPKAVQSRHKDPLSPDALREAIQRL